jgi:thiamine-phosphate pyrophosphorylase
VKETSSNAAELWQLAQALSDLARRTKPPVMFHARPIPPLWGLTDPVRMPDPVSLAHRLPIGSGLIYRTYGDPAAAKCLTALMPVARDRNLTCLVAWDPELACKGGAAGGHAPSRHIGEIAALRRDWPEAIITAAVHTIDDAKAAFSLGADAVLASPVFPTRSPSGLLRPPLGPEGVRRLAEAVSGPVIALGGITAKTAQMLNDTGVYGLAAIDAFKPL